MNRYEALMLLLWYAAYVVFMKYNEVVERFVKSFTNRTKVNKVNTVNDESQQIQVSFCLFHSNTNSSFKFDIKFINSDKPKNVNSHTSRGLKIQTRSTPTNDSFYRSVTRRSNQ